MKRFILVLMAATLCLTACKNEPSTDQTASSNGDPTAPSSSSSDSVKVPEASSTDLSHLFAPADREGNYTVNDLTADGRYLTGNYTTVDGTTVQKYPRLTNLATLYLQFPDRSDLSSVRHGQYKNATYTFVDQYVEDSYYELPLQIKGRGNYSWTFAQKPYSIKLGEKADFLGMGAAKKWTLITVSSDKTMMHNYLTQKMAAAMGLRGTCENEYVDVVVNGKYAGTWVLTERIQIHEERIDVPEEIGVLFEIEMVYRHTCDACIVLYENPNNRDNSVHLSLQTYKGVDVEDMTDPAEKDQAIAALQPFFDGLNSAFTREKTLEAIEKYIDVDSFVNWYLLNELTRNYDSQFVTSCYCYIDETGRLYMGPCWDYDTCYGIQDSEIYGYRVKNAPWFTQLFECPEFVQKTCERWTELRQSGLIDAFCAAIEQTAQRIAPSEQLNHALYPVSELGSNDYDEAVAYFQSWLEQRIGWMDGEFLLIDGDAPALPEETKPTVTTKRPSYRH